MTAQNTKRPWGSLKVVVPLLLVLPVGYRASGWFFHSDPKLKFDAATSQAGHELFMHEWTPGDPLASAGDGLGPVFNAASCVACHRQAGAGGAGPLENNVTIFTRVSKASHEANQGVVHAHATDDSFRETLAEVSGHFARVNPPLADLLPSGNKGCISPPRIGVVAGVDITQRNTPALFGANLIDAIPDRLIIANERKERLKWGLSDSNTDDFPVGRAIRLSAEGRVGKFGWKANVGSLSQFVRVACANELGLGNPAQAQPVSLSKSDYRSPGLDLTNEQCDQITAFVASLPQPKEMIPDSPQDARRAASGKALFGTIGCADCHAPDVGNVKGIYSDLLLHRMGSTLVGGGTYGDPPPELPAFVEGGGPQPSEWRTPPLWGVADSAPYLHDGRAKSLEEAIKLHAGQATKSAQRFSELSPIQQDDLIAFLNTLRAPAEK